MGILDMFKKKEPITEAPTIAQVQQTEVVTPPAQSAVDQDASIQVAPVQSAEIPVNSPVQIATGLDANNMLNNNPFIETNTDLQSGSVEETTPDTTPNFDDVFNSAPADLIAPVTPVAPIEQVTTIAPVVPEQTVEMVAPIPVPINDNIVLPVTNSTQEAIAPVINPDLSQEEANNIVPVIEETAAIIDEPQAIVEQQIALNVNPQEIFEGGAEETKVDVNNEVQPIIPPIAPIQETITSEIPITPIVAEAPAEITEQLGPITPIASENIVAPETIAIENIPQEFSTVAEIINNPIVPEEIELPMKSTTIEAPTLTSTPIELGESQNIIAQQNIELANTIPTTEEQTTEPQINEEIKIEIANPFMETNDSKMETIQEIVNQTINTVPEENIESAIQSTIQEITDSIVPTEDIKTEEINNVEVQENINVIEETSIPLNIVEENTQLPETTAIEESTIVAPTIEIPSIEIQSNIETIVPVENEVVSESTEETSITETSPIEPQIEIEAQSEETTAVIEPVEEPISTTEEITPIVAEEQIVSEEVTPIISEEPVIEEITPVVQEETVEIKPRIPLDKPRTRFCDNCGAIITDDSNTCPECGEVL